MGEITNAKVLAILKRLNPDARRDDLVQYADVFVIYAEAAANIAKHGAIVAHPRTGNPIDNPYLKIQAAAMKQLKTLRRVSEHEELWRLLETSRDRAATEDS